MRAFSPRPWAFVLTAGCLLVVALGTDGPLFAQPAEADSIARARNALVDKAIVAAGIKNARVIQAMRDTPRHSFVPGNQRQDAYRDIAMPIGAGQTISPPFIVAYMTEQLDPQAGDKVLEIGTGSGYQAAVLSPLVAEVYTIEIVESLGRRAARTLQRLKYDNVHARIGDGYLGWPEAAPFDKIIVTCSPESVPQPLVDQLAEGGRMIVPVGERYQQALYLYRKVDGQLQQEALQTTFFVPMTGQAEELRVVEADPANPSLVNGGFEEMFGEDDQPAGWYYVRGGRVVADPQSPDGENALTFSSAAAGLAQALQAFGVDGREVAELEITFSVRAENARPGRAGDRPPQVYIEFFSENRSSVGDETVSSRFGTFGWTDYRQRIKVPRSARLAALQIGLPHGTGTVAFDRVQVRRVGE